MADDLQRADTSRSNLMADVSHELRTPLTVLEGNLRAALDRVYPLDDAEIANLYSQTRHLIRLVNDLRELSLAEANQLPMQKTETDVVALVNETTQALEPLAAERSITLSTALDPLPALDVDPHRIRQALFNLLTNALRHAPEAGHVVVSATAGRSEVRHRGRGRRRRAGAGRAGSGVRPVLPGRQVARPRNRGNRPGAGDREGDRRGARGPG